MDSNKPVIFLNPLDENLTKVKEKMETSAEENKLDIFEIEDLKEIYQVVPSVGQSLIIADNPKKCAIMLSEGRRLFKKLNTKIILLSPKPLKKKTVDKLMKLGLTECISEPVQEKTLNYKINLLIKSLKVEKKKKEEPIKQVNLNDLTKDTKGEFGSEEQKKTLEIDVTDNTPLKTKALEVSIEEDVDQDITNLENENELLSEINNLASVRSSEADLQEMASKIQLESDEELLERDAGYSLAKKSNKNQESSNRSSSMDNLLDNLSKSSESSVDNFSDLTGTSTYQEERKSGNMIGSVSSTESYEDMLGKSKADKPIDGNLSGESSYQEERKSGNMTGSISSTESYEDMLGKSKADKPFDGNLSGENSFQEEKKSGTMSGSSKANDAISGNMSGSQSESDKYSDMEGKGSIYRLGDNYSGELEKNPNSKKKDNTTNKELDPYWDDNEGTNSLSKEKEKKDTQSYYDKNKKDKPKKEINPNSFEDYYNQDYQDSKAQDASELYHREDEVLKKKGPLHPEEGNETLNHQGKININLEDEGEDTKGEINLPDEKDKANSGDFDLSESKQSKEEYLENEKPQDTLSNSLNIEIDQEQNQDELKKTRRSLNREEIFKEKNISTETFENLLNHDDEHSTNSSSNKVSIDYKKIYKSFSDSEINDSDENYKKEVLLNHEKNTSKENSLIIIEDKDLDLCVQLRQLVDTHTGAPKEFLSEMAQIIHQEIGGICSFFTKDGKSHSPEYIGHYSLFKDLERLDQEELWSELRKKFQEEWEKNTLPYWHDESFKHLENFYFYPYFNGKEKLGYVIVDFQKNVDAKHRNVIEVAMTLAKHYFLSKDYKISFMNNEGKKAA